MLVWKHSAQTWVTIKLVQKYLTLSDCCVLVAYSNMSPTLNCLQIHVKRCSSERSLTQAHTVNMIRNVHYSYLIRLDNLLPPARECRSSHDLNAEIQSASCNVPSEDLYLHTHKHTLTWVKPLLKWDIRMNSEAAEGYLWSHRLTVVMKLLL